ncbi:hypothetical protein P3T23_009504 [Paraburkholderia sp. GAS448]
MVNVPSRPVVASGASQQRLCHVRACWPSVDEGSTGPVRGSVMRKHSPQRQSLPGGREGTSWRRGDADGMVLREMVDLPIYGSSVKCFWGVFEIFFRGHKTEPPEHAPGVSGDPWLPM